MKRAIKSIWLAGLAEKPWQWFFVPALFLIAIGLITIGVAFGYLDWLVVSKGAWYMNLILLPFEIACVGFFHGLIIMWGEDV